MSNADRHRAAHTAFNLRDHDRLTAMFRDDVEYTDLPRGLTIKGSAQWDGWAREWIAAASGVAISAERYVDGCDTSIALCRVGASTTDLSARSPRRAAGWTCRSARYCATTRTAASRPASSTTTLRPCRPSSAGRLPRRSSHPG